MRNLKRLLQKCIGILLLTGVVKIAEAQNTPVQLKIRDFAVWGGSASPTSYNSSQGVFVGNIVSIQGNVGSNHLVSAQNIFSFTGNIYSGNGVSLGNLGIITGNIFAAKSASNYTGNVISGDYKINFNGNLTAKGKIVLKNQAAPLATTVTGQVAVPAPSSTNYSGPTPTGGIVNTLSLPLLPTMPNNTAFDNQAGTTNITGTQTISPGKYKKLALTGNKVLTFNGPGNYIFNEVDNGITSNKLVFDFKNTTTGAINIFIIKDATWGRLSVSTVNGNFPDRIYTEIHGNGSGNSGNTFNIIGPLVMPNNNYVWLGNIWAPNGGISFKSLNPLNTPHVLGALWSAKKVELDQNLKLVYTAPAVGTGPGYIDPYYPAPTNGKVTSANNVIGAELISLSQNTATIGAIPGNQIFILNSTVTKVMIEVVSKQPNDNVLKSQLATLGMTDTINNGPHTYVITGNFPINKLTQLNSNTRIDYVRPLYPPISNTGQVTTQGDMTMRSNSVRDRWGLDGSGVKIGVISDSYDNKLGAQADVNEGDLPGVKSSGVPNDNPEPVQVVQDLSQGGNDEGRAMLQIVADIAPKAKLAFSTGFLSAGQFASAIQKLTSPTLPGGPCNIIVDDLTYITEPFQRDGIVAQTVNQVVANGVTYFTSAGNFGSQSYESVFTGVTNTAIIPTGQIHRFGATASDIYQTINLKPGSYTIVLQWSDDFTSLGSTTGVQTDLDLYLVNSAGYQLFGFNRSNISGDPYEVCAFTVKEETNAKVMIVRAAGTANVRFKYVIFRGDATIMDYQTGTSSIVGHPNAAGAITVGAMLYANIPPYTPVWPGVASFSSRGGTSTVSSNTFITRNKPDLIGPNGVNTTVNLGGPAFNDGDTYPNFFGTSAAAPHVAAVGALILQGRKKFNLQATVTPAQIRQQLQTSAGKFSYLPGSFSFEGGYGYVQADSAIAQIANARPVISTLDPVVPGAQNGNTAFAVKITGKYLTNTTQIYVNNLPVTTSVSIDPATGIGTATATVPDIPAGQDPPFQLYNPPKSTSGLDGGKSEALRFFSAGIKILVKAENKSRKYGQENPVFTPKVSVVIGSDTVDISQTSLTLAGLKLDNLVMATNATTFSSPRSYGISIDRAVPLPLNDPLLQTYIFIFQPGTLEVQKMTLKITPDYKVIKYGDDLSGITYTYEFDQSGVVSPYLLDEVKSLHKKYLADNGLIVINGFNQNPTLTTNDLLNMGAMASFQSVRNARKFLSQNGQLQPLNNNIPLTQIGDQRFIIDVSSQSLQQYKLDATQSTMIDALPTVNARTLLNVKALTNGSARAAVPNGQLQPMVNGQLVAMVNGQLQALVNGQLKAMVNGLLTDVSDLTFFNGQLMALVNGAWIVTTNGQLVAMVNGAQVQVDLSVTNGQLQALVNGQAMTLVNGQLQALVNGQLLALVNGQLKAMVNGQLTPIVNGQLMAMVNGQLQAMVNGQLVAMVNGQLMALVNGQLQIVDDIILTNGQLQALVNGQLQALVNGQLKAMVNGVVTDVPTTSFNLVNGQLQALVNGQLVAMVNGQLMALVNGQLQALVNGAAVPVQSVTQLSNGQLQALVNGVNIPIANGQLQALVNGQLLAMVNGQLMAVVNGQISFVVFKNGQLQALVNGQLQALVNGQLQAVVNGQLQLVNSYSIVNGQLQALVNGETWVYPNGQLKALVNGQLQALVNNFDVSGTNNNANTIVLVDEDDINLQAGDVGGMFTMNMITGLEAGYQALVPAAFVDENYEVTYGLGSILITKKPLTITADNKTKNVGDPNPPLTVQYGNFAFGETSDVLCQTLQFPSSPRSIDQLERRTTYTDVKINGGSNIYYATPGESLTLTGNWSEVYFSDIIPGFVPYCPGCITQNYIGVTNGEFTANTFDICYDVSGTGPHTGSISQSFTAPTRPGVYYITQESTWWFYCYQFGHVLQDQVADKAIALVIINPASGVTATTSATDQSLAGNYPIIVGGCYFDPNYRIVFQDGILSVANTMRTMNTNTPKSTQAQTQSVTDKTTPVPDKTTADKTTIERTVPTESISSINKDMLYPNPASTSVRLQLKDDAATIRDIRMYDGVGKLSMTPVRKVSNNVYEISVSGLAQGIYFIEVKTTAGMKAFKFIKI